MELLAGEEGVVCVCVRLFGLEVVVGLLEHGIVEDLILVRGHGHFWGLNRISVGYAYNI